MQGSLLHRLRQCVVRCGATVLGVGAALSLPSAATAAGNPNSVEKLRELENVGGHGGLFSDGKVVRKPLLPGKRGQRELRFYQEFRDVMPPHFLPKFYGVAEDLKGSRFIRLEDLTAGFKKPCILDVKIGQRGWGDDAKPKKINVELKNNPLQALVGFRLSGMKVERLDGSRVRKDRYYGKKLKLGELPEALRLYLDNGKAVRRDLIPAFLKRLKDMERWFATQQQFRFYGTSLLFIYEGDPSAEDPNRVDVRMIDFAHVWPIADSGVDEGYLYGLQSLIQHWEYLNGGPIPQCYTAMVLFDEPQEANNE